MPFPDMHLHCLDVAQNAFDWPVYAFSATSAAIFKSDCKIRDQLEERKSATKLVFWCQNCTNRYKCWQQYWLLALAQHRSLK